MEWQPIETAPKDGTDVIVMYMHIDIQIVHNAFWNYYEGADKDKIGWWSYEHSEVLDDLMAPTHWMPLPAPPTYTAHPIHALRAEISRLTLELDEAASNCSMYKQQVLTLTKERDAWREDSNISKASIDMLKGKVEFKDEQIAGLKDVIDALRKDGWE